MRQNDIKDPDVPSLGSHDMENIFNVYKTDSGKYFYNLLKTIKFPDNIDRSFIGSIFPRAGELLPQLSFRLYGAVNLWWVIAILNNIQNPLEELPADKPIFYLNKDAVRIVLSGIKE